MLAPASHDYIYSVIPIYDFIPCFMNVDTHSRKMSTFLFTIFVSTIPKKMAGTSCLEVTGVDIIVADYDSLLCHVFVKFVQLILLF